MAKLQTMMKHGSYEAYQPMLTSRFNLRHLTKIPLLPLSSTHLTRKTHTRKPVVFQGSFAQPMGEVTTILGADWHRCKVPGKCRVPIGAHRFPSTKQRIDDYTAEIHIRQPSMRVTTMNFHTHMYIYIYLLLEGIPKNFFMCHCCWVEV